MFNKITKAVATLGLLYVIMRKFVYYQLIEKEQNKKKNEKIIDI